MPISVLVRSGSSDNPGRLTFEGDRVVIGRGAFADVRLPDPSVSTRHATIRSVAGEYQLFDEGSTNGTVVGGVRLSPHAPRSLRSGDMIRLGRVWLEVRTEAAPITQDLPMATRDLAMRLVEEAMRAIGDDTSPRVSVVEGPDMGLSLSLREEGRVYVVGRGATCALVVQDPDASREHVQIVWRAGCVLVQDLGAKNRAALGESFLSTDRATVWKRATMLRIGRSVLALREPVAEALEDLERAEDDALPEPDSPPPPPPPSQSAPPTATPEAPAAPAPVPPPAAVSQKRRRSASSWTAWDIAVMLVAVLVLLLSAAGLVWLLSA